MGAEIITSLQDKYIPLNRTFDKILLNGDTDENREIDFLVGSGTGTTWSDLLEEYRVVILSEAGTGKTVELMLAAHALRKEGKAAFFLRLEHVPTDFEDAFHIGSFEEFATWVSTNDEGWLFLDSVDEARLKSPSDFEHAIRKLGNRVRTCQDRAHIFITSRTTAWRPKSDLQHCTTQLPHGAGSAAGTLTFTAADDSSVVISREVNVHSDTAPLFKIFKLADLNYQQIATFVTGSGLPDSRSFLDEVERTETWMFTTRPQDLEELLQFWIANNRIGTRSEIIEFSIARRLKERDQNRRESQPLPADRAKKGVLLLAAATTLCQLQTIQVPDGNYNFHGIKVEELLGDWSGAEISALLARPIFDEAIYGAVRFHHRSVREYLCAEWFCGLLQRNTSRRNIESLFFRQQYGVEVVVPALRPVLCWLTTMDEKMREKALKLDSTLLFEGGDPTRLPYDTRRKVLFDVCAQMESGAERHASNIFAMAQYIANKDLVADVRKLLRKHEHDEYTSIFLLQIAWRGRLSELQPEILEIALSPTKGQHKRITAFKALKSIGLPQDLEKVRQQILSEGSTIERDLIAELANGLARTELNTTWLLQCLEKSPSKERFTADSLDDELEAYLRASEVRVLERFIEGVGDALQIAPLTVVEHDNLSERRWWLLGPASTAFERMIEERAEKVLTTEYLAVLQEVFSAEHRQIPHTPDLNTRLSVLVPEWPELNRALFWYVIRHSRLDTTSDVRDRLIRLGRITGLYLFGSYWKFAETDFDYMLAEVQKREVMDEQRVALSVAFQIYVAAGSQRQWGKRLKNAVTGNAALTDQLSTLFKPPQQSDEERRFKKQEANWKKSVAARQAREEAIHRDWKKWFADHLEEAREAQESRPGKPTDELAYLFQVLRSSERNHSRWADYNWKDLIPAYGEAVAWFYRDSMVGFWRNFEPVLHSEGAPFKSTPYSVIYGLTGLEIEATESEGWLNELTEGEIERACRYASHELNGFPTWFPRLFDSFRQPVVDFLMQELQFELSVDTTEEQMHYIIDDISSSGQWAWDEMGPRIYEVLTNLQPRNLWHLKALLKILQGSSISDVMIGELAEKKCKLATDNTQLACWFAAWVGVAPQSAIPALEIELKQRPTPEAQTTLAIAFILNLLGGGMTVSSARKEFLTANYLQSLYLLMNQYIRREDDEDHTGEGPYTPGLRDDAQGARSRLLSILIEIPGKESFLALREISKRFPHEALRPRMMQLVKEKAEKDTEFAAWTVEEVGEFNENMERTPGDHKELAYLAKLRLLDLKDDLENGDNSLAGVLKTCKEVEVRNYIGRELRNMSSGRYSISQEEELADGKRPDLRFVGSGFDNPVPLELKLAYRWSGPKMFERFVNQLCGDYLRDNRSGRGFYVLVNNGEQQTWEFEQSRVNFSGLVSALEAHWDQISHKYSHIDEIIVVGIDLTKRSSR